MPQLSIITINYNNLEGLKKTFKSVFEQTYRDFEYIVIDGNSKDGSKELIKENEQLLTYWLSEPDKGIYDAMNKGIQKAKGKYIVFMNSGDCYSEQFILAKITDELAKEEAMIYYTDIQTVDSSNNQNTLKTYPSELSLSFLFQTSLCHQSTYIRYDIFKNLGLYDLRYNLVADWKILLEAYLRGYTFKHLNFISCDFEIGGVSNNWSINQAQRYKILQENYPSMVKDWDELRQLRIYQNSRIHKWIVKLKQYLRN